MYTGVTPSPLPGEIPAAVESSPHVSFAVTESLDICYCNPAWDRFASENEGLPIVLSQGVLHKSFLEFVPEQLQAHYAGLFQRARTTGRMQSQDYECSSAHQFRIYRMQIYPLQKGMGFLVINSLRVEREHTREAHEPDDARYRDKNGLISMCANCRRSRRIDDPETWDWVTGLRSHRARDVTQTFAHFAANITMRHFTGTAGK